VSARVTNSTGQDVVGALCRVDIETSDSLAVLSEFILSTAEGDIDQEFEISEVQFDKDTQFTADVNCFCPPFGAGLSSCIGNQNNAGESSTSFLIDDLGKFMIVNKWNGSSDQVSGSVPHIYMRNSFGHKVQIIDGPSFLDQNNINWSIYNNTFDSNVTQNGQGFLFAGEEASLCFQINNTFSKEKIITISRVTFDSDEKEYSFFPHNAVNDLDIKNEIVLETGIKPDSEDGILEKCTEEFRIPDDIKGGNDWDVNFILNILGEGLNQDIPLESDEFAIYGQTPNATFIPLLDFISIKTSDDGLNVTACTDLDVVLTYNYYFDDTVHYNLEYCFEDLNRNNILLCETLEFDPDVGTDLTVNQSLTLPFVTESSLTTVEMTAFRHDDLLNW